MSTPEERPRRRPNLAQRRRRARRCALQALYQWQMAGGNVGDIIRQFEVEQDPQRTDLGYFAELLRGVTREVAALDGHLAPLLSRPLEEVDPVELAALRIAAYELVHRPEIPYRVVINEAVDLAKTYGAEQGYRFVNGIVDRLARELREVEIQAGPERHGKR